MESEKYRKFLEQQAKQNPVKIERGRGIERFRVSWQDNEDRPPSSSSSDILDSFYFGKDMQETVVVDRRAAALLQDRLRGLEEENLRVRKRIKWSKVLIGALMAVVACLSAVLISTHLLPA